MAVLLGAVKKNKLSIDLQYDILMFMDDVYKKAGRERNDVTFRYKVINGQDVVLAEANRYPIKKFIVSDSDEGRMLVPIIERYYKKILKIKK